MTDDLRDLIAEQLVTHPMGLVPVDRKDTTWPWVIADAIISALEADYILVPKSHTLVRMGKQALFGQYLAVGDDGPTMLNISPKENDD